jgi:hypothetical protein
MVSLEDRDSILTRAEADDELRQFHSFLFEKPVADVGQPQVIHAVLMRSIASSDKQEFRCRLAEIERRRITAESEWCQNDCLVFLVLLGCRKFSIDMGFAGEILAAREQNRNPETRKINEVFQSLRRGEDAMEGEYCFLKIPFLHLLGKLELDVDSSKYAYEMLTRPRLLYDLPPFDQLLALRAYDLILFARKPTEAENFDQLIKAVENTAERLTIRQLFRLISAARVRSLLIVASLLLTVATILGGFGYRAAEFFFQRESAPTERAPQSGLPELAPAPSISPLPSSTTAGALNDGEPGHEQER